jgi:spermidine/putrescine transport system substrate-binding protein
VSFTTTAFASTNKLYVYTWFSSIPDKVIKKFSEETGIDVVCSTYESNETMYAKIKLLSKQSSYDIVSPSTYFIPKMLNSNLLEVLDKSKITNFKFINKEALDIEDLGNKFTIPYSMYFTGILYNAKYVDAKVDSWENLFESQYKNKVLLLDDVREVFHVAMSVLGFDVNSVNESEIKAAYQKLRTLLPNVRLFAAESTKVNFISGEVTIGTNWNAESYPAMMENKNLKFVYPKEGAIFSMDSLAILKNAKNKENAYKFINFLLRPDISKEIIEELALTIPNDAAKMLLSPKIRDSEVIFPNQDIIKNSIIHRDVGDSIGIYNKYWEMLKVEN